VRASPVEVGRVACPSTSIVTSLTSLVALIRAEIVTGPTGTLAPDWGWMVLMMGPRPVAVGDATGDGGGDDTGMAVDS
jgi:hypothetical protein